MTTIITETHPRWCLYSQLRKCGEITASADGHYFGLNCIHCATIFPWINIKDFLGHLHEKHASTLLLTGEHKQEQSQQQQQQEQSQQQQHPQEADKNKNSKKRKLSASSASSRSEVDSAATTAKICSDVDDDCDTTETADNDGSCDTASNSEDQWDVEEMQEVCELIFETMATEPAETDLKLPSKPQADKTTLETDSKSSSDDNEEEDDDDDISVDDKLDLFSTKNREVLKYIIEVHAENAILWDKEHKFSQMFHKKLKIYKVITKEIETRFKLKLKYTSIRQAFAGLRKLYTDELLDRIDEENNSKNIQIDKTPLWCFEQLEFLRKKELADNSTLVVPIDQLMLLAEIYRRHPVLWNFDCDDSHHKARKVETQHKMLYEVNAAMDMTMTLKQLRARITRLRKFYIANKRKRLESAKNNQEFAPEHPGFYAQLQFLEPYVGPFRCEKCGEEKLASFHAFRKHMAAHEGRLQYTCRYCQKEFKLYTNMETHERRHTGEKPYVCTFCDMRFATSTDLKLHATRHTGEKNYVCHICGHAFGTASHLRNHKLRQHANHVKRPVKKTCSLHKKSFEVIDNEVFICFENSP